MVMKYFIIFCLLLFLGTVLNLAWIKYFVGPAYWQGLKVVPVLLLANLCLGVVYNLSVWYKLSGQTRFGAIVAIAGAAITLIINVIFVPAYSYIACAWATLAAYGGMMILSYFFGQKHYPVKYNLRAIMVYTLLTLALYAFSFIGQWFDSTALQLVLNNLLILVFVWIVYKLEFNNLKNLNSNVVTSG